MDYGFHSINVPSEWGLEALEAIQEADEVSIQLMSPASGDEKDCSYTATPDREYKVSIQLMSPASGD